MNTALGLYGDLYGPDVYGTFLFILTLSVIVFVGT